MAHMCIQLEFMLHWLMSTSSQIKAQSTSCSSGSPQDANHFNNTQSHSIHGTGIFTCIFCLICMVNVGKYIIHGCYGNVFKKMVSRSHPQNQKKNILSQISNVLPPQCETCNVRQGCKIFIATRLFSMVVSGSPKRW